LGDLDETGLAHNRGAQVMIYQFSERVRCVIVAALVIGSELPDLSQTSVK